MQQNEVKNNYFERHEKALQYACILLYLDACGHACTGTQARKCTEIYEKYKGE